MRIKIIIYRHWLTEIRWNKSELEQKLELACKSWQVQKDLQILYFRFCLFISSLVQGQGKIQFEFLNEIWIQFHLWLLYTHWDNSYLEGMEIDGQFRNKRGLESLKKSQQAAREWSLHSLFINKDRCTLWMRCSQSTKTQSSSTYEAANQVSLRTTCENFLPFYLFMTDIALSSITHATIFCNKDSRLFIRTRKSVIEWGINFVFEFLIYQELTFTSWLSQLIWWNWKILYLSDIDQDRIFNALECVSWFGLDAKMPAETLI